MMTRTTAALSLVGSLTLAGTGTVTLGPPLGDTIRAVDAAGDPADDVAIYVSGSRFGGCFCGVHEGHTFDVGNMTPGRSHLAVFSEQHAVHYEQDVTWSYLPLDEKIVVVEPPVQVPLVIWRLSAISTTMSLDAQTATEQLQAEEAGIVLVPSIRDVSVLGIESANCSDAADLKDRNDPTTPGGKLFDDQAINVYYTESCGPGCLKSGLSCQDDRRVNFVYAVGSNNTLLHELGHALLGVQGNHWMLSISPDNFMNDVTSPEPRKTASTGQVITMSYEQTSVLEQLGLQRGRLNCLVDCPKVEFDKTWSDCAAPLHAPPPPTPPPPPPPEPPPPFALPEPSALPQPSAPSQRSAPPQPSEVNAIDAWLNCEECSGGQLDRVINEARANDKISVQRLAAVLDPKAAPDPWLLEIKDERYRANAIARRQLRALSALEILASRGTPFARSSAQEAISRAFTNIKDYRADVQRELKRIAPTIPKPAPKPAAK